MNENKFLKLKDALIEDITTLVRIDSLADVQHSSKGAPFGKRIRDCFDAFASIASKKGFIIEEDDGYAISACIGEGETYIGVLGHLDIVDAGDVSLWKYPPYEVHEENGMLYGRGVNDDKGPLLAALYAAWMLKEEGHTFKYPIRIIAGGAEETTWECMRHYFKTHAQPIAGFSPDGNFPIVNGEKGILQARFLFPLCNDIVIESKERMNYVCDQLIVTQNNVKTTFKGKRALSRNPQRGENAIYNFVSSYQGNTSSSFDACMNMLKECFLYDDYGHKSGLYSKDEQMGETSFCPMSLTCNASVFELCVDIRYVKSTSFDEIWDKLIKIAQTYNAKLELINHKKLLFVDEESTLIKALKKAYQKVMCEEAQVMTKGGASYARVLDVGVAFGATFPDEDPKPHMPNECMPIDSLLKACEIYYEALYELAIHPQQDNN